MRVMKPRQPINKNCIDCGYVFVAYSNKALRCPKCRKEHLRQMKADNQARYRTEEYKTAKAKRKPPKMSMSEVLAAQEKYNKEHKTHISYGKFVQMLEG